MSKWAHGAPGIPRPGVCYLCRKRPGEISHRSYWTCKQCMRKMYFKDALAMLLILSTFALLILVARDYGLCPVCPGGRLEIHARAH